MRITAWIRAVITGQTPELEALRREREESRQERDRATDEHLSRTQRMQEITLRRADEGLRHLEDMEKNSNARHG